MQCTLKHAYLENYRDGFGRELSFSPRTNTNSAAFFRSSALRGKLFEHNNCSWREGSDSERGNELFKESYSGTRPL